MLLTTQESINTMLTRPHSVLISHLICLVCFCAFGFIKKCMSFLRHEKHKYKLSIWNYNEGAGDWIHWDSLLFVHTESQQDSKFTHCVTHIIAFHLESLTLSVQCGKPISRPFFIYQPLGDLIWNALHGKRTPSFLDKHDNMTAIFHSGLLLIQPRWRSR